MILRGIKVAMAGLGCMLAAGSAIAQHPTSFAESSAEYNAYVYSYNSRVVANGLANSITTGEEAMVADLVADFVEDGFFHCYDALMNDDDSQWAEAVDDLDMALLWCDTLEVFSQGSQSNSTLGQINNLQWYLGIAIANAEDAMPTPFIWQLPATYPFLSKQSVRMR